jgi:PXPV repeat (3 copies)
MKRIISIKSLAAVALAFGALAAASAAHARSDVYFSVGVQGGPAYVEQAPVYVQPAPVYVQPRPVYVQPPAYVPPPVYERRRPAYDHSYEDERAWRPAERRRYWRHRHDDRDQYQSRGRNWD